LGGARHQRAGLDDRLRLRAHREPGRAHGQRQRRGEHRRVPRLAADHPGDRRGARRADAGGVDRLQPGRLPGGVRGAVRVLGGRAGRRGAAPAPAARGLACAGTPGHARPAPTSSV
ncbi:MAG: Uncharacterized MFS-type transporter, partial [uncultured Frankineae bacterium]